MKEISIEELKRNVGQWVKIAADSEPLIIIVEGKPVARITGVEPPHLPRRLPDREDKISKRSRITVDSAYYLSEMRG